MPKAAKTRSTASSIRLQIERGGERLWRHNDFRDQPFAAIAQTLSRLTRNGTLERLSKGVYYRPRSTAFGPSRPSSTAIKKLAERTDDLPSGAAAANLLGFSTQTPRRSEVATSSLSLPRKLIGAETHVHVRRPEAWKSLSETEAALLDFLPRAVKQANCLPNTPFRRRWPCWQRIVTLNGCSRWLIRSRHGFALSLAHWQKSLNEIPPHEHVCVPP